MNTDIYQRLTSEETKINVQDLTPEQLYHELQTFHDLMLCESK